MYHVLVEESRWSQAEYWLEWDGQAVIYRAEGRDNPKDLWGFEYRYPPRVMDESTLDDLERIFGGEARAQVLKWLERPEAGPPSGGASRAGAGSCAGSTGCAPES